MTRRATVRLRTATAIETVTVDASVLATDAALVDKARRQAGIAPALFLTGEVVA
ncbi:hypothetical protein [Halorubrum sodomense]|uniref:Uncharacterized protein n=1 Tax=Halorubrum sodomense TaxID=35743 RepID=A0A1I6H0C7_HALSD|nr:hypothetical protein [Halorubrum sodomense]SFR47721.1 hypothetical protein SAMN04487937_2232 [Halorubrum sodomense]